MLWINLQRLIQWRGSLQNGILWHTMDNGWRWRVYDRYRDGSKRCITYRLLSPEGKAYEQTTYSVNNRQIKHSDEEIAWAVIEVIKMKEDETG